MDSPHSDSQESVDKRRHLMREALMQEMNHHHARLRTHRRNFASALLVLLASGIAFSMLDRSVSPSHETTWVRESAPKAVPHVPSVQITVIRTQKGILDRYAAPSPTQIIERIDDRRLLRTLAMLDRPTGMVRSEGRVWLTSDITDNQRLLNDLANPDRER